jgi:hypothetical protein
MHSLKKKGSAYKVARQKKPLGSKAKRFFINDK